MIFSKIFKIVFFITLLLISFRAIAQQNKNAVYRTKIRKFSFSQPDSAIFYITKLKHSFYNEHDTIKAKDYNNFSFYYLYNNQKDSALYYLKKSLKLSSSNNKPKTLLTLGLVYKKVGDFDKALKIYDSVSNFDNVSLAIKGNAYSEMASIYSTKVDFNKSKFYFLKAIDISKKINDSTSLNVNKINFGNFYKKNNLPELALPYYEESLAYYNKNNNKNNRNHFVSTLNLASCYVLLNRPGKALELLKSIDFAILNEIKDNAILATYYNIKAVVLNKLDSKQVALESLYLKSLNYAKESKDTQFMGFYNKYLEYLVELRAVQKINKSILEYNLDSVYDASNLIDKIEFQSILSNTNLDIEFKEFEKGELFELKDSLTTMTTKTIKEELLSNQLKYKNAKDNQVKLQTKQTSFIYLIVVLIGVVIVLIIRNRIKVKRVQVLAQEDNSVIHNSYQASILELKKEVLDINLTNALNEETLIDRNSSTTINGNSNAGYWNKFKQKLKILDPDFIDALKKTHLELSTSDLDLCLFIKLNMSNKEIAELLNIEYRSVIVKKSRLKNKLNISKGIKLEDYIFIL